MAAHQKGLEALVKEWEDLMAQEAYPQPELTRLGSAARRLADTISLALARLYVPERSAVLQWRLADNIAAHAQDLLRTGGRNVHGLEWDYDEISDRIEFNRQPTKDDVSLAQMASAELESLMSSPDADHVRDSAFSFAVFVDVLVLLAFGLTGHIGGEGTWQVPGISLALVTFFAAYFVGRNLVARVQIFQPLPPQRNVLDQVPISVCRGYDFYIAAVVQVVESHNASREALDQVDSACYQDWLDAMRAATEEVQRSIRRMVVITPPAACKVLHELEIDFLHEWERILSIALYTNVPETEFQAFGESRDSVNDTFEQVADFCIG
jgi:hypothetical protein